MSPTEKSLEFLLDGQKSQMKNSLLVEIQELFSRKDVWPEYVIEKQNKQDKH